MGDHYLSRRSVITALIVVIVALLVIGGVNWLLYRDKSTPTAVTSELGTSADKSQSASDDTTAPLHLYFIALGDNGASGAEVGCSDSLIETEVEASNTPDKLREAFERLLSNHDQTYGGSGLYNALYQSRLQYESGGVEGDTVTVKLSGEITQGGTCDTPRIKAQLTETAEAASGASRAEIFINNKPLKKALSQK